MSLFKKVYGSFTLSALVIAAALSVARIFLMNYFYDPNLENYMTTTNMPMLYNVLLIVCCIALFSVYFFVQPPKKSAVIPQSTVSSLFASSLCGFFFISSVFLVVYINFDFFANNGLAMAWSRGEKIEVISFLLTIILSLPSAVFFLKAESTKGNDDTAVQVLSFFPVLWSISYLIYLYFDNSVVINNSEKLYAQLSVIFIMLYLTSEAKYRITKPKHHLHLALSLVTIVVVATYCIPNLILTVMLVLPFDEFSIYSGLQVAILIYAVVRTFQFASFKLHEKTAESV